MSNWCTPTPGVLYRHYDRCGVLLYVGSSNVHRFELRQDDHARTARWWPYVARIEREEHLSRRAAYLAEFAAIKAEQPIFNRTSKTLAVLQADREARYLEREKPSTSRTSRPRSARSSPNGPPVRAVRSSYQRNSRLAGCSTRTDVTT